MINIIFWDDVCGMKKSFDIVLFKKTEDLIELLRNRVLVIKG